MSEPPSNFIDPLGMYRRKGGVFAPTFCSAPHPRDKQAWCRRFPGHDGDHKAFTFSIRHPESWPAEKDA